MKDEVEVCGWDGVGVRMILGKTPKGMNFSL